MTGQMFLRTAQTEDRISALEKRMDELEQRFSPAEPEPEPVVMVPPQYKAGGSHAEPEAKPAAKKRRA
jgi:hypothetical protein